MKKKLAPVKRTTTEQIRLNFCHVFTFFSVWKSTEIFG